MCGNRFTDERGMALVLCLMIMSTLLMIGVAAHSLSHLNQKIVFNYTKQLQAFYMAEAGLELAMVQLKQDPLWRGDDVDGPGTFAGQMDLGIALGDYRVVISDRIDDGQGLYDDTLPASVVGLAITGTARDATAQLGCLVSVSAAVGPPADSPRKAVVTAGPVTGNGGQPIRGIDDQGRPGDRMIDADAGMPTVNLGSLAAMASGFFPSLDNQQADQALAGQTSFWRDPPTNTVPNIIHVKGDLSLSGDRMLGGIIFVEGERVSLSGDARINGVIYAPNAISFVIDVAGDSMQPVVTGQIIAGAGGIQVIGTSPVVQLVGEYVDAFNEAAGPQVEIEMVAGSWQQSI
ncbi:MAG: pilus assembly PilX N-terminal domain-containing protein [Deltaproteobacteria bacterium]|nr:pilus assembly PilX N-terminal domain-containing protein [Deltaproteobacteria bacterium]